MKIKDKVKKFLEEVKDTIDWIVAGCPKPVKIPIDKKGRKKC